MATPGVTFGESQTATLQVGTTDYLFTSGLLRNDTQFCSLQPTFTQCPYLTAVGPPEPPMLVGFEVRDADDGDAVLSVGDEYLLTFDRPTDQHACEPDGCSGGRDYVHRLFAFSHSLASDFVGEWRDNSTFAVVVTRVDAGFAAPPIGGTLAALRPSNEELLLLVDREVWLGVVGVTDSALSLGLVPDRLQVRTADGLSGFAHHACAAQSFADGCADADTGDPLPVPTLRGDYGSVAAPTIAAFVASDPDNFDEVYSAGDELTLHLSMPTDALLREEGLEPDELIRPTRGDRAYVDVLFSFSHSLGADYSGEWRSSSTFTITALDVTGAGAPTMSGPCTPMNRSLAALPEDSCVFDRLVLTRAHLLGDGGGGDGDRAGCSTRPPADALLLRAAVAAAAAAVDARARPGGYTVWPPSYHAFSTTRRCCAARAGAARPRASRRGSAAASARRRRRRSSRWSPPTPTTPTRPSPTATR